MTLPAPGVGPVHHSSVSQLVRGDVSSLTWLEGPLQASVKYPDLVKIVYSSINFRDVMLATGKLAIEVVVKSRFMMDAAIGFEFSGIDGANRKIMGLKEGRCLANMTRVDESLAWEIPSG